MALVLNSNAPAEPTLVGANGQSSFDTLIATGNTNFVPATGLDSFGFGTNTFGSAQNLTDIANKINSNTSFSTKPDVFGNPALSSNGTALDMMPTPLAPYKVQGQGQYDTYSGAFGLLANYYGPFINASKDMSSTPANAISNTFKVGSNNVNINVGVDFALGEEQNTFGTPQYFRALGQQLAPTPSLTDQANTAVLLGTALHDPQSQAISQSAQKYLSDQAYANSFVNYHPNNDMGGSFDSRNDSGSGLNANINTTFSQDKNGNPAPLSNYQPISVYSSWSPVLPMQAGQDPFGTGHLYGMLPGERFLGSGTGVFVSPNFSFNSSFNYPASTRYSFHG